MSAEIVIYAFLAGILPSFIWLIFWLHEDADHPEPHSIIAAAFIGGAISVLIAALLEKYAAGIFSDPSTRYKIWASIEEIVKFLVVASIALKASYNDEPIDAMIYAVSVALGFAAMENSLFILGILSNGDVTQGILTGGMRFIGATLVHVVSSALIGYCLGWAFYRSSRSKFLACIIGLIAAISLHAYFNLSIVDADAVGVLKIFTWIWAAVVVLIILFEEVKGVKPQRHSIDCG